MTLKYALQEGFINIVKRSDIVDEDGGTLIITSGVKIKFDEDSEGIPFLVGVANCEGRIPYDQDQIEKYIVPDELVDELFVKYGDTWYPRPFAIKL